MTRSKTDEELFLECILRLTNEGQAIMLEFMKKLCTLEKAGTLQTNVDSVVEDYRIKLLPHYKLC